MEQSKEELLALLYTEFETRPFHAEQASLLCGLSLEMLEELVEEGYIRPEGEGFVILHIDDEEEY